MSIFVDPAGGSISDAVPAKHLALPPYRAELFNPMNGWAGVMNRNGANCLTFKSKPGAVITSFQRAEAIADAWNTEKALAWGGYSTH